MRTGFRYRIESSFETTSASYFVIFAREPRSSFSRKALGRLLDHHGALPTERRGVADAECVRALERLLDARGSLSPRRPRVLEWGRLPFAPPRATCSRRKREAILHVESRAD